MRLEGLKSRRNGLREEGFEHTTAGIVIADGLVSRGDRAARNYDLETSGSSRPITAVNKARQG
jgi:hypothetical protein